MLARVAGCCQPPRPVRRSSERRDWGYSSAVLGEQEALVLEVRQFPLHGVTYYDLKVAFRDRSVHDARLGPESVPSGLQPGDEVLAMMAANMIVSSRRPES